MRTRAALPRPAWLLRVEHAMRPLDHLPRRAALGAGAAAGAAAGLALGWSGEPWTLAAGLALLGGAGWLVASAEPVAVVAPRAVPAPTEPLPPWLSEALGMLEVPGGRFWMGSADADARAYPDEHPRHEVTVAAFSMARYAVTQKLYREVAGSDPGHPKGDDLPANQVSWFDAIAFCNRLSERGGLTPAYLVEGESVTWQHEAGGYRLPTEAEWECACRAGTETAYSFGDDEALLDEHAWWAKNAAGQPHPVGTKKPSSLGLFDVHGNVYEWCWDTYGSYDNPRPSGGARVVRGGSFWHSDPWLLRSALRAGYPPADRYQDVGFRCARGGFHQL